LSNYLVVAIGGALGAVARYWVATVIGTRYPSAFPYPTLIINITGSFVIGLFLTLVSERLHISPTWRLGFAVGFVGAYTTFSTFEFETFKLIESGAGLSALMYVAVSLILGFAAVWGGIALAHRIDAVTATRLKKADTAYELSVENTTSTIPVQATDTGE